MYMTIMVLKYYHVFLFSVIVSVCDATSLAQFSQQ